MVDDSFSGPVTAPAAVGGVWTHGHVIRSSGIPVLRCSVAMSASRPADRNAGSLRIPLSQAGTNEANQAVSSVQSPPGAMGV